MLCRRSTSPGVSHRRRAIVTVMVVMVLLLMSALLAEFVRRAVADRRQMRQELLYRQTILLAEAGIERLQHLRLTDPNYAGETWNVPAGIVHQTNAGTVVISLKDDIATVTAQYPSQLVTPLRVTRSIRLSP